jgi:hypothetical protein
MVLYTVPLTANSPAAKRNHLLVNKSETTDAHLQLELTQVEG